MKQTIEIEIRVLKKLADEVGYIYDLAGRTDGLKRTDDNNLKFIVKKAEEICDKIRGII